MPSPTRCAPSGPRSPGSGIDPSESPPVDDAPPRFDPALAAWARSSAAVTMRVTAIGEMALTTTPAGATRPSCHVSDATARLAQLEAPASAARQPEPDVTPRMRP